MKKTRLVKKIGCVIACILINFLGKYIAANWNWPIWLDMVGTCVAAYFLGPVGAVLVGLANNFVFIFWEQTEWIYCLVSALAALAFSFCAKRKYLDEFSKAAVSSFWIGVLCMVASTPINLILYNGYSGNMWGDALFDMLSWYGWPKVICAIAGELVVESVDKQINVLLAFCLIRLILSVQKKWNKDMRKSVAALGMIGAICLLTISPVIPAKAVVSVDGDNYLGMVYNNRTGMLSSEANVIEETDDGYIWIGSYAGLTRYDGSRFEFIREGGITNVTCMVKDYKGRLWIGTNDNGIARYEDGKFTFFKEQDGLPVNSIRSFATTMDGKVYVGTTDRICCFDVSDTIEIIEDSPTYIISMVYYKNVLVVVDNNGEIYGIKDDVKYALKNSQGESEKYTCVTYTHHGLTAGTEKGGVHILEISNTGMKVKYTVDIPVSEIVMIKEGELGKIWVCTEKAIGYWTEKGSFQELKQDGFDASFEWIHEDFQGNIWVASSRYGVLKYSQSRFKDLFALSGEPGKVANAVVAYNDNLYCATDVGLVIIDSQGNSVENELTQLVAGCRIRSVYVDAQDNLWICCYSEPGLVCYNDRGRLDTFSVETKQTTSDKFRCAIQLKDSTIVVGTADGINFIKGDQVVGTIKKQDGLQNSQILTLVEGEDGILYAGSDGGGIYAISNQKIVKTYTVAEGLSSDVILRMIPYDEGYFVVTSNSLCYMDEQIRVLDKFPYFNNYDVIVKDGMAYVLSSAGIYEVDASALKQNVDLKWRLYSASDGLVCGITANSWNMVDANDKLLICCNSGVVSFDDQTQEKDALYLYDLNSIVCDGKLLAAEDGVYTIPSGGKRIIMSASVRNYALTDVKVKFFVEGYDDEEEIRSYQDLSEIQMSNILSGDYKIHLQIWNDTGDEMLQEKSYVLHKERQVWENSWYWAYLLCVCGEIIAFTTWTIILMINVSKRKAELEKRQIELQEKVAEQTEEIRLQKEQTEDLFLQTVIALSEAVDAKDRYTSGHSKRVAAYSKILAARMGKSEEEQEEIYFAGLLHDVGKIRVPGEVINKPGKLTDKEFELIKIHPVTGYHILKGISGNKMIAIGAKFHHERYDGKGYPNGLSGENIPEIARIIAVADSYDAMASNRSYRDALPQEVVRSEIEKGLGTQFDPEIAKIMLKLIDDDLEYQMKQTDGAERCVLIVDDELMNVKLAEHVMAEEPGYRMLGALSGSQALEILKQEHVDLILLDINMPDMDGFETMRHIRQMNQTIPVVFLTADRDMEILEKAAELGVDDYLTKPFFPLALKEVVRSMTQ